MLTIQAWLQAQQQKSASNIPSSELMLLLAHLLKKNRAWLYSHSDFQLTDTQLKHLNEWSLALSSGKPLAYITGEQMFWDLNLKVNEHTLIPRPDTEIVIETVLELLENNPPSRILDLGTGSGALALVLAQIYPKAKVMAVDQSNEALQVAEKNAANNSIHNISFLKSDWFSAVPDTQFDLIVSNPPYIAEDDEHLTSLMHEPLTALVADLNGMGDYIRICNGAKKFLVDTGLMVFEHGWQQQKQVRETLINCGFNRCDSRKDLAGHDRVTFAYK